MIGKTISHYRIVEKIGSGGMGIVYKAEDIKLKRNVALKFLPPELTRDSEARERFIHEARSASTLDHPNICTIYEITTAEAAPGEPGEGQMFIVMAYYEGETLQDKIADAGAKGSSPPALKEALDITIQIANGLNEAHKKNIYHRDIKPANIFVTQSGTVKILDFGLAKFSGQTKLTRAGTTLGTAAYMSPEQAQGSDVDNRSDIWSLGVVLYEMITGQLPFKGDYEQAMIYSIVNDEPQSIMEMAEQSPAGLEQTVKKALKKTVEDRYQSVEELLADLQVIRKKIETSDVKTIPEKQTLPSIAVLPFVNMSADPEQEYFCDGMTEELINALIKIENIQVPARTSAFAFKGEKIDVREIGRKLNVATVLEGSVRKAGNRLRITAQLINVADGYHLWSERYDRQLDDVFAIQDEISLAIVDKLKVELLSGEKEKIVKRYTENLEAYNLYLKGLFYWNSLTPEGWEKSYICYQQAIALDSNYALAYVGLAIWHESQAFWGEVHPRETSSKSRELLLKVFEIDDTLSDAHNVLGVIYWCHDWNRSQAQREFQISLELEPANVFCHINFALFLATGKEFDQALRHAKKVQELDPLSSLANTWAASIMSFTGLWEESVSKLKKILESDPHSWQPFYYLSWAYIHLSKFDDAIFAAENAVNLSGGASIAKTFLGCACALAGQTKKAREQLDSLLEKNTQKYVPSTFFVMLYTALEETEKAYNWLENAIEDRDPWLWFYGLFPGYVRSREPRFDNLLKENNLVF